MGLYIGMEMRPLFLESLAEVKSDPRFIKIGISEYLEPMDTKTVGYASLYAMGFYIAKYAFNILGRYLPIFRLPATNAVRYKQSYNHTVSTMTTDERAIYDRDLTVQRR